MKKGKALPIYYPVFLNVSGRRCVVVGGGQVALRKVKALLEHGASVEIISPELCPELGSLAQGEEIRVRQREYCSGDLEGAFMAIAATDDSNINLAVVKEARKKAVLVNVVDNAGFSDFIVPSYIRRGDIAIAVSTSGRSPALARKIRSRLEKDFGEEYASLTLLIGEVRREARERGIKVDSDAWQEALDLDLLLELVRAGEQEKARAVLLGNLLKGEE